MRAIAGAILILAGVIPYSFAELLRKAEWSRIGGQAQSIDVGILQVTGVVFVLGGISIMIWGFITDQPRRPQ